jgi:hypothetical protein
VPFYLVWMEEIVVLIIGLLFLGVALFLVRRAGGTAPNQTVVGRLASLIAFAGVVVFWLTRSWFAGPMDATWRYAIPLAAATLAVAVYAGLGTRTTSAKTSREVDLAPRSVWSFGSSWWFAGLFTLAGLLLSTVILAGLASSTDDEGRHTLIVLDIGNAQAATVFFGWAFGVPVLIGLAALLALVFGALWVVARPAVPADPRVRDLEVAVRRNQARTVLAIASGATAFTLGAALLFIGRSSALAASFSGPEGGRIELVTSFAALGTPFMILGLVLQGLGVALVIAPLCQPNKRPARETADSTPPLSAAVNH